MIIYFCFGLLHIHWCNSFRLDSYLNHIFRFIPVFLIVGIIHYCFFYLNNTYHNTLLTFPMVKTLIDHHTSGEYLWPHLQIQHPPIFEQFTLHHWTSHNYFQTCNLASSWWTNQLHCHHHLSISPLKTHSP